MLNAEENCEKECFFLENSRLEIGYSAGKLIALEEDYAEIGLFLPLFLSNEFVSFADVKGYRFNDSEWGSSAGIGIRKNSLNCGIVGANFYYDYKDGNLHKGFHRVALGLEWLRTSFDFRINGYLPIGNQVNQSKKEFIYTDNFRATCVENESCTSGGFDAELGSPLFSRCDFVLYGAIGPYFYHSKARNNYWGGQARLELNWKSYLSLQVRTSYDRENHSKTQGRIILSVPLDFFCSWQSVETFCDNLFMQPVERNGVIFTNRSCCYKWNW